MAVWIGFICLICLNAIDYLLTKEILKANGTEYNPIMRWVIKKWSWAGMAGLKCIILLLLFAGIMTARVDAYTIWFLVVYFSYIAFVMYRDCLNIRRLKKINTE